MKIDGAVAALQFTMITAELALGLLRWIPLRHRVAREAQAGHVTPGSCQMDLLFSGMTILYFLTVLSGLIVISVQLVKYGTDQNSHAKIQQEFEQTQIEEQIMRDQAERKMTVYKQIADE